MRTRARNVFFSRISELNKYFTCMLFLTDDFYENNEVLLASNKEKVVSEVFVKNKYKDKFNCQISKLSESVDEYFKYSKETFVILMYQAIDDYFTDIINIGERVYGKTHAKHDDGFYASVTELFNRQREEVISDKIMHSIEFFRTRRNCIVHRNAEANRGFTSLIKNQGSHLNKYWSDRDKRTVLQFNQSSVSPVTSDEVIESFNISRACIREIDENLTSKMNLESLLFFLLTEFKALQKTALSAKEFERKFKSFCRLEYDLDFRGASTDIKGP